MNSKLGLHLTRSCLQRFQKTLRIAKREQLLRSPTKMARVAETGKNAVQRAGSTNNENPKKICKKRQANIWFTLKTVFGIYLGVNDMYL